MVNQQTLNEYCNAYLKIADFVDYCPNGLQIEGKENIKKIMAGVSANLALIDCAIDEKVDALFVHHGFFWKGENQTITGIKKIVSKPYWTIISICLPIICRLMHILL